MDVTALEALATGKGYKVRRLKQAFSNEQVDMILLENESKPLAERFQTFLLTPEGIEEAVQFLQQA